MGMNPYTLFVAFAVVVCVLILALAAFEWIADAWANYQDGADRAVSFADIKALPETTCFDRVDLPRARLRSVPVAGARLSVVPPPADDAWLLSLLDDDPLRIPEQRVAGGDE